MWKEKSRDHVDCSCYVPNGKRGVQISRISGNDRCYVPSFQTGFWTSRAEDIGLQSGHDACPIGRRSPQSGSRADISVLAWPTSKMVCPHAHCCMTERSELSYFARPVFLATLIGRFIRGVVQRRLITLSIGVASSVPLKFTCYGVSPLPLLERGRNERAAAPRPPPCRRYADNRCPMPFHGCWPMLNIA